MKINSAFLPSVIIVGAVFLTAPRAEAQIQNGSFENGTYSSTLNGVTNSNVPVDWVSSVGFDADPNYNDIRTDPYVGLYNLSIGNLDDESPAMLSQTFADISGNTYTIDFEVYATSGGDPGAYFDASAGSANLSLSDSINSYTLESLTFTGTGSDTLTFSADTNPGEWYVDDVTVQGNFNPVVSDAPDSGTTAILLALGLAGLGLIHSGGSLLRRKAA